MLVVIHDIICQDCLQLYFIFSPHEIATFSKNTFSFTKISLVIVFKIDMELNMSHLADLFQNCQSPQVIVVGASYTRQILNLESKYMSEPRHITFLAEEIY